MLTIHVWPKRLKEFLLTHPLYKSPTKMTCQLKISLTKKGVFIPQHKLLMFYKTSKAQTRNFIHLPQRSSVTVLTPSGHFALTTISSADGSLK